MCNGQRFDGYGDGRTSDANRGRVHALLRLFAESGQAPTQRAKREYTVGNAGIYIKTADKEHLAGRDLFWGAIRPAVSAGFRACNAKEDRCGAWLFVSPTEVEGEAQCWLVPAALIDHLLDRWVAHFARTQEQLHVHIRATGGHGFELHGCGEPMDVTQYHMRFPVV